MSLYRPGAYGREDPRGGMAWSGLAVMADPRLEPRASALCSGTPAISDCLSEPTTLRGAGGGTLNLSD